MDWPSKGVTSYNSSYSITPTDHQSQHTPYCTLLSRLVNTSGLMYSGVPTGRAESIYMVAMVIILIASSFHTTKPSSSSLAADPKSTNLMCPVTDIRTFSGLTSRCAKPSWCSSCSPATIEGSINYTTDVNQLISVI